MEILFRGKCIDNGKWVEGFFYFFEGAYIRVCYTSCHHDEGPQNVYIDHEVIPETVSQLMPIKDANGQKLFEGDIVSGNRTPDNFGPSIVLPKRTEYRLVGYTNTDTTSIFELPKDISYSERSPENHIRWVLAGNKFDNPEILKSL